ncbi:hypothetical protein BU16DRAFT_336238 [Lophium mytilinum]|uniref:Secreted protein n=1 Tax=Lophium mytilinum TaxID=390894 RepID=A0A6A6QVX7_9PEZI|nr:hypothetical protein BU16DRAFT_336238 [Lophium mytilinum]
MHLSLHCCAFDAAQTFFLLNLNVCLRCCASCMRFQPTICLSYAGQSAGPKRRSPVHKTSLCFSASTPSSDIVAQLHHIFLHTVIILNPAATCVYCCLSRTLESSLPSLISLVL